MALAIFRDILCCCRSYDQSDERDVYDERRHLIVPEISNADDTRMVQKKIRERLTEIVRSKEVKMVNVSSQIPFNLHNQVIPKAQSHSSSRSGSVSFDQYYDNAYYSYSDFHSNQDIERFRKQRSNYDHGLGRLRSDSPSYNCVEAGPSARTRSLSPAAEQHSAARFLNIRLVGYDDIRIRGRARERGAHPTGFPGLRKPTHSENGEGDEVLSTRSAEEHSPALAGTQKSYDLDLPDPNAMIVTWGD